MDSLPQIWFSSEFNAALKEHCFKVIDRHGKDITDLIAVKSISFKMETCRPYLVAELRLVHLPNSEYEVFIDSKVHDNKHILKVKGYDLIDGLEPNSLTVDGYAENEFTHIVITFDAQWNESLAPVETVVG